MRKALVSLLLGVILAAFSVTAESANESVRAYVNRNPNPVNLTLIYTIELTNLQTRNIRPPDFKGFKVSGSPSQSTWQSINIGAGGMQTTTTISIQYSLREKQKGRVCSG